MDAAAPAAPLAEAGGRRRLPRQPRGSTNSVEAHEYFRGLGHRPRTRLPSSPERLLHGDARPAVRRPVVRHEGLLVRAAELSRARLDPRAAARRTSADGI